MVIEEGEGPVGREGRKPQRQPSELHRHRVDVDPEQAALGDDAAEARPLRLGYIPLGNAALADEGGLVGGSKESARGHQECAASHRRIQHSQR